MQQPLAQAASGSQPKVAIPRLPLSGGRGGGVGGATGKNVDRNRVLHACEPCRQKKTKCSGEKPTCQHCQHYQINCYYGDGKRDRAKNEMKELQDRLKKCEKLLEKIGDYVEAPQQLAINDALGRSVFPLSSDEVGGEALAPGDSGSTGALDHISEDVPNNENSPLGYVGKPSTKAWIQRAAQHLESGEGSNQPSLTGQSEAQGTRRPSQSLRNALSDYNDDPDLSVDPSQIDPTQLPPKEISDRLIATYFDTVNPFFPIVRKSLFLQQYEEFYGSQFSYSEARRWLAVLNLIMAVSAVYCHMVRQPQGDPRDHLQYYARARMLSFDGAAIFDQPDMQQVQVAALASFYMIATNQLNRAWNVNGIAIRYAQTLGLNLHNESSTSRIEKDIQSKLWFAIRSLERLLAVATGRPLGIREPDCTAAVPKAEEDEATPPARTDDNNPFSDERPHGSETHLQPPSEDSSSRPSSQQTSSGESSLRPSLGPRGTSSNTSVSQNPSNPPPNYFAEADFLGKITEDCLLSIYSPAVVTESRWVEVQGKIAELETKLAKWKSQLHPLLDFTQAKRDRGLLRLRMALGMQYHHLRMLINRPCLCGSSQIPHESKQSKDFTHMAARACVEEARNLIRLFPRDPNPVGLTSVSPWWNLLYYLSSAGAIIILAISLKTEYFPDETDALLEDASMILDWVKSFGTDNVAAKASWSVLANLLQTAATKIGKNYEAAINSDFDMGGVDSNIMERFQDFQPMIPAVFPMFSTGPGLPGSGDQQFESGFDDYGRSIGHQQNSSTQEDQYQSSMSRMFPTPEQMTGYNLMESLNDHSQPSEGPFAAMLSSSMNWEQPSDTPPPPAHLMTSEQERQSGQGGDQWLSRPGFNTMRSMQGASPEGYQSGGQEDLSASDSKLLDDTIRARDRDRRRSGSRS